MISAASGQPDVARGRLLDALEIDPRNAVAHYNLAILYEEAGEAANAIRHYRAFLDEADAEHAYLAPDVRARIDALSR